MRNRSANAGEAGRKASPDAGFGDMVSVEVLYVRGTVQIIRSVTVPKSATAAEVVDTSGLMHECSELSETAFGLASFGRRLKPDSRIATGDRIEILLPLEMSPKEARRRLAAKRSAKRA